MASIRTKFSVGLFVIIGLFMVVIIVLWLGMSEYFQEGRKYVAFFEESVQGLSQDSTVKYRGVDVGRVDKIGVAPDGRLVQIVFTLNKKLENPHNLVAQIKAVGITGIMFVELERSPKGRAVKGPRLDFEPDYPVIATKPSEMRQFLTDLYDILSRIKQIDIKAISNRIESVLKNVDQTIADAEMKKISTGLQQVIKNSNAILNAEKWNEMQQSMQQAAKNLNRLIENTDQTVARMDGVVESNEVHLKQSLLNIEKAANNAAELFDQGADMVQTSNQRITAYDRQMTAIMENLQKSTTNLNRLLDQLSAQPSQIFFSQPRPAKPIEGEK